MHWQPNLHMCSKRFRIACCGSVHVCEGETVRAPCAQYELLSFYHGMEKSAVVLGNVEMPDMKYKQGEMKPATVIRGSTSSPRVWPPKLERCVHLPLRVLTPCHRRFPPSTHLSDEVHVCFSSPGERKKHRRATCIWM